MRWRRPNGSRLGVMDLRSRVLLLAALLAGVGALREAFVNPAVVGVSFLALVPILLAARWFGPRGGVLVGALAAGLSALQIALTREDLVLPAALLRLAVFVTVGFLFARLHERDQRSTLELARRESELEELRVIQEVLVPSALPEIPGLDLAASFIPAEQGVGGDFYLVSGGPEGETVVVVGDAVGKGLEAARQAAFVRATLATFAPFTRDPGRLLGMVNGSLLEREGRSESFVTAACVAVRPREQLVSWALAGHPAPRWLHDGGELAGGQPGLPLGVDADLGCQTTSAELTPGSGIVLFTDGLTEARRRTTGPEGVEGELLGTPRVAARVAELAAADAAGVVRGLRSAAEEFSGGALTDDLCVVALRVHAPPALRPEDA